MFFLVKQSPRSYSIEIALTGQESITSWQSQSPQSSATTLDFPFSSLKTLGHKDSQVPHPMHKSSLTFGLGILAYRLIIILFSRNISK